jgi:hypothetical protein
MNFNQPNLFEIRRSNLFKLTNLLIGLLIGGFFIYELNKDTLKGSYLWIAFDVIVLFIVFRGFFIQLNSMIKNKPALSINTDGIYLETYGFIPKQAIKNVEITEEANKTFVVVFLENPEGFLEQVHGVKKHLFTEIFKRRGTPVVSRLKGRYDKAALKNVLNVHINKP